MKSTRASFPNSPLLFGPVTISVIQHLSNKHRSPRKKTPKNKIKSQQKILSYPIQQISSYGRSPETCGRQWVLAARSRSAAPIVFCAPQQPSAAATVCLYTRPRHNQPAQSQWAATPLQPCAVGNRSKISASVICF